MPPSAWITPPLLARTLSVPWLVAAATRCGALAIRGRADWQSGPTSTRFTLWLPLRAAGVSA